MTARSGDVGRPQPIRSPSFVGRQAELAALAEALHGPRAVVLIEGESGIGKSRLLREFLAGATACGLGALLAVCPPFREPFTLGPVVDALRQATDSVQGLTLSPLAGALRPLFPEWAAQLPPALEPAEDATAARHRLFRAIVELLDCLRVRTLIVEDVHWADEATLEFLLFLATSNSQERSLVVTYRLEDVPDGSLLLRLSSRLPIGTAQLRLALAPLDVTDTEALVASMFPGSQVSREFAEFVHEHTDGVPLAVEESLRLMHERADLTRRDGAWVRRRLHEIAVPPTVRDAVLERAGRLGPDAQAVLHAAAVLSDPTDETTLLAIAACPDGRRPTGALIEHWDGTRWTIVDNPLAGQEGAYLSALTVVSATDVWAVGRQRRPDGTTVTLAEHWDGTAWTAASTPSAATPSAFYGVDASGPGDVWAVGVQTIAGTNLAKALVERWDGTAWQVVPGLPEDNGRVGSVYAAGPSDV